MQDEIDPRLLRAFAAAGEPLAEEPFVSTFTARLRPGKGLTLSPAALYSVAGTIGRGVANAVAVPLRVKGLGWLTLGGAAFTVLTAFL
jgi:hypothetical protein